MSKLPLPARGQPIDVPFIYDIVSTVNELSNQVADSRTNSFSSILNRENVVRNLKTADVRISARFEPVDSATVASDSVTTFSSDFGSPFIEVPIVTATLFHTSGQNFAAGAVLSITNVTQSQVGLQIYWPKGGTHQGIYVQIVAVGAGISQ